MNTTRSDYRSTPNRLTATEAPSALGSDTWLRDFQSRNYGESFSGSRANTTVEIIRPFLEFCVLEKHCRLAEAWSADPVRRQLILLAEHPASQDVPRIEIISYDTSFTGEAANTQQTIVFDNLLETRGARQFQNPTLIERLGLQKLISVPVLNTWNPNQVLLVVNIYPGEATPLPSDRELRLIANFLSTRVETDLRERCFRLSTGLTIDLSPLSEDPSAPPEQSEKEAARLLAERVRSSLRCDWVAVFLERWDRQGVELTWRTNQATNSADADRVEIDRAEEVWRRNREFLEPNLSREDYLSAICDGSIERSISVALVPIHDVSGNARGVIRCGSRLRQSRDEPTRYFTYDDVAIIEAIGQAFAPRLEILLAAKQRNVSLQKLAHELRVPVVAFRAVLERVQRECRDNGVRFRYDHFTEMTIYVDLMNRLLKELDIVRMDPRRIPLVIRETSLLSDIIMPAKRFLAPLLRLRGFTPLQITYSGFENAPKLYVDPALLTQVVFNLLDNSIKSYPDGADRSQFRCRVKFLRAEKAFEIIFEDNGIGVPSAFQTEVFKFGRRAPRAHEFNVEGGGIGLWIAKEVAIRHGGDLLLRRCRNPTEFVLQLPKGIAHVHPRDELAERPSYGRANPNRR